MKASAQEKFLAWAATKDNHWPETKQGNFQVSVLDEAIQEGIVYYLKKTDITPLRDFLELAAKSIPQGDSKKLLRGSFAEAAQAALPMPGED